MADDSATVVDTGALYHYCNTDTFLSIVRSRSIWLSSLSLSNDTMEGRLVNQAIMRLADRDGLDAGSQENLRRSLAIMEGTFDGLGFCLSREPDLLSQWRGYADDARGISIGFSHTYLEQLARQSIGGGHPGFKLQKVEYDPHVHESLVEPTYRELRKLIDAGAFKLRGVRSLLDSRTKAEIAVEDQQIEKANQALTIRLLQLFPRLFELKTPAFREGQREWRLVSILVRDLSDECLHRPAQDRIVPYRSFELASSDVPAFAEVVLGPKHQTPALVVKSMLKHAGFGDVEVRRSSASYR